jgi:hypothetical protein
MAARINVEQSNRLPQTVIVMVLALASARAAVGQATPDAASNARIKKLIASLASPNKEPPYIGDKDDYPRVKIPVGYDRAAQRKILDAWRLLQYEGTNAFPSLVASLNDKRYSCTVIDTPGDGEFNLSVGGVCNHILQNQVGALACTVKNSYGPNVIWWRAARKNHFDDTPKWWHDRQNRSLAELQIELAQSAIEILKSHPGDYEGVPDLERRKDVRELEILMNRVKASGQPINPTGIENRYRRMIGLPGESDREGGKSHPYKDNGNDTNESR